MSPVKRIIPEIWERLRMTMGTLVSRKHQFLLVFLHITSVDIVENTKTRSTPDPQ
jgi:hypothetical protein